MSNWMEEKLDPIELEKQVARLTKESREEENKNLLESWNNEEVDKKQKTEVDKVNAYLKMEALLKERDRLKQNNEALKEAKRRQAGL